MPLSPNGAEEARLRRWAAVLALGLLAAAAVGIFTVFRFADAAKNRDLEAWRERLTLVATAHAQSVDEWLALQRDALAGVARNPTLRFFLSELHWTKDAAQVTDGAARLEIIRTYLLHTAAQAGFSAPPGGVDIAANVPRPARAGLVILDMDGRTVAATPWSPPVDRLAAEWRAMKTAEPAVIGPYVGEAGEPTLAVVAPIPPIDGVAGDAVGLAVGVRLLDQAFFSRLAAAGDSARTGQSYLVRAGDGALDLLSPLPGRTPLAETLPDTPEDAAAFAHASPGAFAVKRGPDGKSVLVVGERLKSAPWTLVRSVPAQAALGEITARRNATLAILGLVIVILAVAGLLLWRHGASLRAAAAAAQAADMARRYHALSDFLKGALDAQPTVILSLDADGLCRFGNRQAGLEAGQAPNDLAGKTLAAIFGSDLGRALAEDSRRALAQGAAVCGFHRVLIGDAPRTLKVDLVPLALPRPEGDAAEPGVLLVLEDISALITERERREQALHQLVNTLVALIDSRDPFAARHSRWVAELCRDIAEEMDLEAVLAETAEIAGALLNIGKVFVRRDVLTKTQALSAGELKEVRASVARSAELLRGLDFNGPVAATVEQAQAHWDGSGVPQGLSGDDILITARILAVANAFVGMISARAHRPPLALDTAMNLLIQQTGTVFDRRPVAALMNYLDNHGGRAVWQERSQETIHTAAT